MPHFRTVTLLALYLCSSRAHVIVRGFSSRRPIPSAQPFMSTASEVKSLGPGLVCARRNLPLIAALFMAQTRAGSAAAGIDDVALPQYDEEGKLIQGNGYSEETSLNQLRQGAASVSVLGTWTQRADGTFTDPVNGEVVQSITMTVQDTKFSSIKDLGRPEQVKLVSALGLPEGLERADLVAAAARNDRGIVFYDFDLALPALKCVPELATACLPERVILLSCCVTQGKLHLLKVDAKADQWRRAGAALRNLRSSFTVRES